MAATNRRTTPVARTPKASASAGSATPARARGEAGTRIRAGGILTPLRQRVPEWLSSLEGPRKLTINALIVAVSLLGSGVVVKAALKHVVVPFRTTAENLTGWMLEQIAERLATHRNIRRITIRLQETERVHAEMSAALGGNA